MWVQVQNPSRLGAKIVKLRILQDHEKRTEQSHKGRCKTRRINLLSREGSEHSTAQSVPKTQSTQYHQVLMIIKKCVNKERSRFGDHIYRNDCSSKEKRCLPLNLCVHMLIVTEGLPRV